MIKIMTDDKSLTIKSPTKEDSDSLFNQLVIFLLERTNGLTEVSSNPIKPALVKSSGSKPEKPKKNTVKVSKENNSNDDPDKYGGFLYIRCPHCGEIKGFCAKHPMNSYKCDSCGEVTYFFDEVMTPMYVRCPYCGNNFKYITNITDDFFLYNCLNCDSPIDLEYNTRRKQYNNLGE